MLFLSSIFITLYSFVFLSFFGRLLGRFGTPIFSICCILYTFIVFGYANFFSSRHLSSLVLYCWLNVDGIFINCSFTFDTLFIVMGFVVSTISFCVQLFSMSYMNTDPHVVRFFSYLSLFTFFMLILISSDNLLLFFFGWEGVGICSYLLISFWFTRVQACKAAIKAVLMNKISDLVFLVGISLCLVGFKTADIPTLHFLVSYQLSEKNYLLGFICFFFLVGAVGKSAQVGLHLWLPDAMEGPTPVSALIHSATMVTAGIFLILRFSIFFEYSPSASTIMTILGLSTAFFSSLIGVFQNDIKKVVAYSTCSQLGYMMVACGLSKYTISFYHLVNHAFFKAALFLSCGCIIHIINEQDIRSMGGLFTKYPLLYSFFLFNSLSLVGFPFFSGFFSKELIINFSSINLHCGEPLVYLVSNVSATLTALYSVSLLYFVFLRKPVMHRKRIDGLHTMPFLMYFPIVGLTVFSIVSGFALSSIFSQFSAFFVDNLVDNKSFNNLSLISVNEYFPYYINITPLICSLLGFLIFFGVSNIGYLNLPSRGGYMFIKSKLLFDTYYNRIITKPFFGYFKNVNKYVDKGIFEVFGPYGASFLIYYNAKKIFGFSSTGFILNYVFLISVYFFLVLLLIDFFA